MSRMTEPDWWGGEDFTAEGARALLRRLATPYDGDGDVQDRAGLAYEIQMRALGNDPDWSGLSQFVRDAWVCEVTDQIPTPGREGGRS